MVLGLLERLRRKVATFDMDFVAFSAWILGAKGYAMSDSANKERLFKDNFANAAIA